MVALALKAGGLVETPLLVAMILSATSLGVIIPVLKDAGEIESQFGQLVVAAGSIADFGAIILLSVLFAGEGGTGATLVLIGCLLGLAVVVFFVVRGAERSMRIGDDLVRLQDTTAQIRVRGAMVLLIAFAAVAEQLGLEVILGAFAAGAVLTLADRDEVMTHPDFRRKLEAIGFGVFIPVFFVTSGHPLRPGRAARRPVEPRHGAGLPGGARGRARPARAALPAADRRRRAWSPGSSRPPRCRSSSPPRPSAATST